MPMNNTKIGGRISEIDIIRFVLERLNDNAVGRKFKMGLNENFLYYKPLNEMSKLINEEYIYDDETYELNAVDFIPTIVVIRDMGLTSNLDMISGSASVSVVFMIQVDDPMSSELDRLLIEELRDTLRQGFYVSNIPQRPYSNTQEMGSYKKFKFNTNTGTINYDSSITTINGKNFIQIDFDIDIDFNDMAIVGNEFLVEMAVKPFGSPTFSEYERIYPLNIGFAVAHAMKDIQALNIDVIKNVELSNENSYNEAYHKYTFTEMPNSDNIVQVPIGAVIKYNDNYYKVIGNVTPFEEQKSWETHSQWQSKGFGLTLDLVLREQYPFEKVGIIRHLYNDLIMKKFGYTIYKLRIRKYRLELDNKTWTYEYTLFERALLMVNNETAIELGSLLPMTIPFVVSDLE